MTTECHCSATDACTIVGEMSEPTPVDPSPPHGRHVYPVRDRAGDLAGTVIGGPGRWTAVDRDGGIVGTWSSRRAASFQLLGEPDPSDRRNADRRHGGALTGTYPAGHLESLRGDWPE